MRWFGNLIGSFRANPNHRRRAYSGVSGSRQFKPAVEQLDQRLLPSLSPVTPTAGSPFQAVVELQVTYPDHHTMVGTGAMIDSSHVLTAAHLLYSAQDGGYATSVEAIPAANGARDPFGIAFGTYERVDPSWFSFNQAHPGMTSPGVEDIGLVTLNRAIGTSTGWFNIGYNNNNSFFNGATFQTAGYPGGTGSHGPQMYTETGRALGVVSNAGIDFSQSSLAAAPGQSGSPIWQSSAHGAPVIYGVLTGANGLTGLSQVYASRITQSVYNELQSWEGADRTPPVYSSVVSANQVTLQHPAVTPGQLNSVDRSAPVVRALDVGWASLGWDESQQPNFTNGFAWSPDPYNYSQFNEFLGSYLETIMYPEDVAFTGFLNGWIWLNNQVWPSLSSNIQPVPYLPLPAPPWAY